MLDQLWEDSGTSQKRSGTLRDALGRSGRLRGVSGALQKRSGTLREAPGRSGTRQDVLRRFWCTPGTLRDLSKQPNCLDSVYLDNRLITSFNGVRWFRTPADVTWSRSWGPDVFRVRVGGIGHGPLGIYIYIQIYVNKNMCVYIHKYICIHIYTRIERALRARRVLRNYIMGLYYETILQIISWESITG